MVAEFLPHAIAYYCGINLKRRDGLVSIFERFDQATAIRIATGLNELRAYVRGDVELIRDIACGWETYERLFPKPQSD